MKAELRFNGKSIPRVLAWVSAFLEQIKDDKEYVIECREYRRKRSNNANAYYWTLINAIVNRTPNVTNDSVHFEMLKDYGQVALFKVRREIDVEKYGIRYFEREQIRGGYAYYRVYKGSSEMNGREMSRLIDGAVQEAKNLGIETLPPDELRALCERWNKDKEYNAGE